MNSTADWPTGTTVEDCLVDGHCWHECGDTLYCCKCPEIMIVGGVKNEPSKLPQEVILHDMEKFPVVTKYLKAGYTAD